MRYGLVSLFYLFNVATSMAQPYAETIENSSDFFIFAEEQKFTGQKNERRMPVQKSSFLAKEKKIITAGDASTLMHVYQITDKKELQVLQDTSRDIVVFKDSLLQLLANRMLVTVQDPNHPGVGIAAPQVGINRNLICVQRHDKADNPFEFFVNPKITWQSKMTRLGLEGCLSIPDRKEEIQRSYAIRLQYQTLDGTKVEENVEGFTAVIFQHEIDHLHGILYPDRLEEQKETESEQVLLSDKIDFFIGKGVVLP